MILGEEGKPSLDELAHHGVKGMRWGQHKSSGESSTSSSSAPHPTSADIHGARQRHNARIAALHEKSVRLSMAKTPVEKAAILKDIHAISKEGLSSGDHVLAGKVTKGEKIVSNVLVPVVGGRVAKKSLAKQAMSGEDMLKAYNRSKISDYYHE